MFRFVFPQQVLPDCLHTVPFFEQNRVLTGTPNIGSVFIESEQLNYIIISTKKIRARMNNTGGGKSTYNRGE